MWNRCRFIFWTMLILFGCSASVLADGKLFSRKGVKETPTIPHQRALLSFRNGMESLTIETSVDAKSQALGWIIPLPAEPTTMTKVSPGALKTLDLAFHPDIQIGSDTDILFVFVRLCFFILLWTFWVFWNPKGKPPSCSVS